MRSRGDLGFWRARSAMDLAASVARAARAKSQGPSGKGWLASISPASAVSRSVLGVTFRSLAALPRLSQGSRPSSAGLNTGMRWCERRDVTRSRVQRLPLPVLRPLRLSHPGDQVVAGDERELTHGRDDVGGGAVALPAPTLGQADLVVDAAGPMDRENDLRGRVVDIGHDLVDQRAHDALLQPRIGGRGGPRPP